MKKKLKLIAAALAAITALSCTSATAYADKLKTVDGVTYRYSDSGKVKGKYTGWAKNSKGNYYYQNGIKVKKNTTINGVRYKFDKTGLCLGKFTGFTKSSGSQMYYYDDQMNRQTYKMRRYWKNGKLVQNKWVKIGGKYHYFGIDGYEIVDGVDSKFVKQEISPNERLEAEAEYIKNVDPNSQMFAYLGTYGDKQVFVFTRENWVFRWGDVQSGRWLDEQIPLWYPGGYYLVIRTKDGFRNLGDYDRVKDETTGENRYKYMISADELIQIRYFLNCFMYDSGITSFEAPASNNPTLSDEARLRICEDYLNFKADSREWKGITAEELKVRYLGTYNGCEVVTVYPEEWEMTDDIQEIEIAGYTITLGSGSLTLMLHKDGTFTEIREAYEKGYLTKSDIKKIANYNK